MTLNIALLHNGIVHHGADHRLTDPNSPDTFVVTDSFPKVAFLDGHTWRMTIGFSGVAQMEDFFILKFLIDVLDRAPWYPLAITRALTSAATQYLAPRLVDEPHTFVLGLAEPERSRIGVISNCEYFDIFGAHREWRHVRKRFHCTWTSQNGSVILVGSGADSVKSERFHSSLLERFTSRDWYDGGYYARSWIAGLIWEAASRNNTVSRSCMIHSLYANGAMGEVHANIQGGYYPLCYIGGTSNLARDAMLDIEHHPGSQHARNYTIQPGNMEAVKGSRKLSGRLLGLIVQGLYPDHIEIFRDSILNECGSADPRETL